MEMIKTFLGVYDIPGDKDHLLEAINLNMEAAMKQQPMPVKIVVFEARMCKHTTLFGLFMPAIFYIKREYQCPRCGKVLCKEPMFYAGKDKNIIIALAVDKICGGDKGETEMENVKLVKLKELLYMETHLLRRINGAKEWTEEHSRIASALDKLHKHFSSCTFAIPTEEWNELKRLTER